MKRKGKQAGKVVLTARPLLPCLSTAFPYRVALSLHFRHAPLLLFHAYLVLVIVIVTLVFFVLRMKYYYSVTISKLNFYYEYINKLTDTYENNITKYF